MTIKMRFYILTEIATQFTTFMFTIHAKDLQFLEHFYGDSFTFDQYEILTVSKIPKADRAEEAQLMHTKWFDYRLMPPMQATYYFYHLYVKAYQHFLYKNVNSATSSFIFPFKGEAKLDFLKARERTSIWRLRQLADLICIPYDIFLSYLFKFIYKMAPNGSIVVPRPSMMMKEDLIEKVITAWNELKQANLQLCCSPYFYVANYRGLTVQKAYEDYLIEQVKQRKNPHYLLAELLYNHQMLRIETAIQHFDNATINNALDEAKYL